MPSDYDCFAENVSLPVRLGYSAFLEETHRASNPRVTRKALLCRVSEIYDAVVLTGSARDGKIIAAQKSAGAKPAAFLVDASNLTPR
jgi:Zn-dependent M28 family amino/carboxypeptidase